jgi:hypothetical protein
MKDITRSVAEAMRIYTAGCKNWRDEVCRAEGECACRTASEMWGFIHTVIPRDCQRLSLKDFTGESPRGGRLPENVVVKARNQIMKYCWDLVPKNGVEFDLIDFDSPEMLQRSVIDKRRENGNCLVIHCDSLQAKKEVTPRTAKKGELPVVRKLQTGKTLLASIVMKEVIRRRVFAGHRADTYDWVSFPTLRAHVSERNTEEVADYKMADWLVVDGITKLNVASEKAMHYQLDRLDALFSQRADDGLPTILVFQFDLDMCVNLEEEIGVGMARIVNDKSTCVISLTTGQ